jgi:hypothetical protein
MESENAVKVVGGIVILVLGWALTSMIGVIQDERKVIDKLDTRLSVLETEFWFHRDRTHVRDREEDWNDRTSKNEGRQ